jgi:hypothetical protein
MHKKSSLTTVLSFHEITEAKVFPRFGPLLDLSREERLYGNKIFCGLKNVLADADLSPAGHLIQELSRL